MVSIHMARQWKLTLKNLLNRNGAIQKNRNVSAKPSVNFTNWTIFTINVIFLVYQIFFSVFINSFENVLCYPLVEISDF